MISKKILSMVYILPLIISFHSWSDDDQTDYNYGDLKNLFMQETETPFLSLMPKDSKNLLSILNSTQSGSNHTINLNGKCFSRNVFLKIFLMGIKNYEISIINNSTNDDTEVFRMNRDLISNLHTDSFTSTFYVNRSDEENLNSRLQIISETTTSLRVNLIGREHIYKWIMVDHEYLLLEKVIQDKRKKNEITKVVKAYCYYQMANEPIEEENSI
ncbi:MAG: hypothetical protein OXB84_02750 [Halobacteriovoraceae bacterium]|nr:hypothetical protein [Halobacteriovoraceae bacterium]